MEDLTSLFTIDKKVKTKSLKKGEFLQRAGDEYTQSVYVKKGLLRSYIIDENGKEHIFMFAAEGWIMGDIEALEFNQPAQLYIQCIEDTDVILFNKAEFSEKELTHKRLVKNTQLLSRRVARLQRRVLMLMGTPAKERYEYFLEIYPELPNRIPQKMIASFLGIMPQTLSTIRKKMAKGM